MAPGFLFASKRFLVGVLFSHCRVSLTKPVGIRVLKGEVLESRSRHEKIKMIESWDEEVLCADDTCQPTY